MTEISDWYTVSAMSVSDTLLIKDDKRFLESATKLLESSPSGQKNMIVKKLNNDGKVSRKQLYLSLAHGSESYASQVNKVF